MILPEYVSGKGHSYAALQNAVQFFKREQHSNGLHTSDITQSRNLKVQLDNVILK